VIALREKTFEIWVFEVEENWIVLGTQVAIKGNNFEFINAPGGEGTRAIIRRQVESLLKGRFELLMPNETDKLRFSMPQTACPN
jgi:hypothetical protein